MKLIKQSPLIIGFFVTSLIILVACNKTAKDSQCTISKPTKVVALEIGQTKQDFSVWVGATRTNSDFTYSFSRANQSSSNYELQNVLQKFGADEIIGLKLPTVIATILFVDKALETKQNIIQSDIKGILIYSTSADDKLLTTVLKKSDKNFEIIEQLNSKTDAISSNDILSIASIFKASKEQFLSAIELATFEKLYKRDVNSNFRININIFLKNHF